MGRRLAARAAALMALVVCLGAAPPMVQLPPPRTRGDVSLEEALARRRSRRQMASTPLPLATVGQLLWAAQGVTNEKGFRTAPSAGARYPLELYVLLPDGLYHYRPGRHALERTATTDLRAKLWRYAYARPWLREAPAIFVVTAVYARTAQKYGAKAERFADLEAGHAAQNLLLEATALRLNAVGVGAFDGARVRETLGLPRSQTPLYLIPVGNPP